MFVIKKFILRISLIYILYYQD